MNKFKIGDKIIVFDEFPLCPGNHGVVIKIMDEPGSGKEPFYNVCLDGERNPLWLPESYLYSEKGENEMTKFKVGDRVIVSKPDYFPGSHGVIVRIMDKSGSGKEPFYKVYLEESRFTVWFEESYLYSEKGENEMTKFKIGDIVYVTDSKRYANFKFENTRGQIVWLSKPGDTVGNIAGIHFEGMHNEHGKDGRFYFPVECLKGENKMTRSDGYITRSTLLDEVHDWKTDQLCKNLFNIANRNSMCRSYMRLESIDHVIFNPPATIVFWVDGSKTVVKCGATDEFDPEKGLAMAITKKALGNKHNYYDVFWKYLPKEYKKSLKNKKFKPCEEGYDEKEIMCYICEHREECKKG